MSYIAEDLMVLPSPVSTYHKCICGNFFPIIINERGCIYHKCNSCNEINQINSFSVEHNVSIEPSDINPSKLTTSEIINVEDLKIDVSQIDLVPTKSFLNYLPYFDEIYELGEEMALLDLMFVNDMVDLDAVNSFELFDIVYRNMHIGIVGIEVHNKDKENAWISWTIIQSHLKGKGIGSEAVRRLISKLKEEKKFKRLYVDSDTNEKTINFYKKLDFKTFGTAKEFKVKFPKYKGKLFLSFDQDIIMYYDL